MLAKIQKWGNSQGLRLTKSILKDAEIEVGDEVDISIKNGDIIISPARKCRGRHSLSDLVAQIPEDYRPEELDWGKPVGKEIW